MEIFRTNGILAIKKYT